MSFPEIELTCLGALDNYLLLWYKKLGYVSFSLLNKLVLKDLVVGLPKSKFKEDKICDACEKVNISSLSSSQRRL